MTAEAGRRACSLHVLLARRSPSAVIYRRGSSRQTALIRWDRATDTFETGQWFKGSVCPDRSALAPDGAHLLTFMGTFRPPFLTWTALSRPPHFMGLALWPKGDTWGGGGTFLTDRTFALDHNALESALAPGFSMPEGFVLPPPGPATQATVAQAATRDPRAWRGREGPDRTYATRSFLRDAPCGLGLTRSWHMDDPARRWDGELRSVLRVRSGSRPLDAVRWIGFDANDDLLFAIAGRLYRCPAAAVEGVAGTDDLVARSRLLADLTDLDFRALAAPYAPGNRGARGADEPAGEDFAPVLDRVTKEDRRMRQAQQRILRRQGRDRR